MPTVVALLENARLVDDAVREIEALGFPVQEVRRIKEPAKFEITGVMSFPRLDFKVDVSHEHSRIGATVPEVRAYVERPRRGGALAFATGSDEKVAPAGNIMNLHGAVEVEDAIGSEPELPGVVHHRRKPMRDSILMAGRIREPAGGAHVSCGDTGPLNLQAA